MFLKLKTPPKLSLLITKLSISPTYCVYVRYVFRRYYIRNIKMFLRSRLNCPLALGFIDKLWVWNENITNYCMKITLLSSLFKDFNIIRKVKG
jgi:hypothetical protein